MKSPDSLAFIERFLSEFSITMNTIFDAEVLLHFNGMERSYRCKAYVETFPSHFYLRLFYKEFGPQPKSFDSQSVVFEFDEDLNLLITGKELTFNYKAVVKPVSNTIQPVSTTIISDAE